MKTLIKPAFFYSLILLAAFGISSCKTEGGGEKKEENKDPKELADEFNDAKFKDKTEAEFLVEAAAFSLAEVELAKKAQSKASSADVKQMAKTIESDHGKLYEEIKQLAGNKQITIPAGTTDKAQNDLKKMDEKSGEDADKQFCEQLVDDHDDMIKKFEKAQEKVEDIDVKNWVTKALPILRNHLDHAMTCHQNFKSKDGKDVKKEVYNANKKTTNNSLEAGKGKTSEGGDKGVKDRDKSDKKEDKKGDDEKK